MCTGTETNSTGGGEQWGSECQGTAISTENMIIVVVSLGLKNKKLRRTGIKKFRHKFITLYNPYLN